MTVERISDMTLEDLNKHIVEVVDRRIQQFLKPADKRAVKEINESIRRNRWTPPEGVSSTLELLREDRDR